MTKTQGDTFRVTASAYGVRIRRPGGGPALTVRWDEVTPFVDAIHTVVSDNPPDARDGLPTNRPRVPAPAEQALAMPDDAWSTR